MAVTDVSKEVMHCYALALQFLICNCSQVQVVCAVRSLMSGSSNV